VTSSAVDGEWWTWYVDNKVGEKEEFDDCMNECNEKHVDNK